MKTHYRSSITIRLTDHPLVDRWTNVNRCGNVWILQNERLLSWNSHCKVWSFLLILMYLMEGKWVSAIVTVQRSNWSHYCWLLSTCIARVLINEQNERKNLFINHHTALMESIPIKPSTWHCDRWSQQMNRSEWRETTRWLLQGRSSAHNYSSMSTRG